MAADSAMSQRSRIPEAFLVSLGAILLEVSYTRVFSFKLVYYFTYLVIGMAMLGLGAGGVFVAIAPRLRTTPMTRLLPACGLGAGVAVALGYLLVATVQLNLFELVVHITRGSVAGMVTESLKLFTICLALLIPFLLAGIVLARIFATQTDRIGRLYGADLAGAGMACALCIPLLTYLSPPGAVWLAGAVFVLAALPLAAERSLVEMARAALTRGQAERALAALRRHARQFPNGELTEEREGLLVQALVGAQRYDQAREKAEQFKKRYPRSLFAPVVDQAIGSIP